MSSRNPNGRGRLPDTEGQVGSDLAESIQNAVSGAITTALAPVLQSLQGQSAAGKTGLPYVGRGGSSLGSDEDDFEPVTKKRYILLQIF